MGNEMGNSNTSGLQEEDNPTIQVQGKSLQEATHADGAEGENHIFPVAEHKDNHEKGNGLASDIPNAAGDSPAVNQILEGRETVVHHPAESPEVEVKSNEAGGETIEFQPTSPSNDSKDHDNPPGSVNVAQGNHIDPVAEGEEALEKEIDRLVSEATEGAGESHVLNQISDEGGLKSNNEVGGETREIEEEEEEEETEVHFLPESSAVTVNSTNEAGGEKCERKDQETEVYSPPESSTVGTNSKYEAGGERSEIKEVEVKSNNVGGGETSEIKEQEETEVHSLPESSTVEVNSKYEAGGERSEIKEVEVKSNNVGGGETSEIKEQEETEVHSLPESSTVEVNSKYEAGGEMSEIKEVEVKSNNVGGGETSEIKKQEETEVHSLSESSTVELKSNNEAGGETGEIRPNSPPRDVKNHEQQLGLAYVAQGENHIVPVAEGEDYPEVKIDGLTSVVPDGAGISLVVNQISDEREQKEMEVNTPAESSEVQVKSNNEEGCEISDIQPTSISKDSNDHELPQESNLKEKLTQISNHQLENQSSVEREEEGDKNSTTDTISSSNDPEPQKIVDSKFDQPELAAIHVNPLVQDGNRSPEKNEDILGSNLTYTSEKNGQAFGTNKDVGESVVSVDTNGKEQKKIDDLIVNELASKEVSCEERLVSKDDEFSSGLGKRTMLTSEIPIGVGVGIKCNGELPIEVNQIASDSPKAESGPISMDKSLNTLPEGTEAIEDCIVLTAATILTGEESEHGENKANDQDPTESCGPGESVEATKTDKASVSASKFVMIESEPENNERRTSDNTYCDSGSNEDRIEQAKVAEDRQLVDGHTNDQNEAPAEPNKDSQKEAVMVLESEMCTTELFLTGFERSDDSEEKKVIDETEGKTRASYGIGNDKEGRESLKQCLSPTFPPEQEVAFLQKSPLYLVQTQGNQQNHEKESKQIQSSNESISELQHGSFGEFFVADASSSDSKNLMAGPLVPVPELATKQDLSQCTVETPVMKEKSGTPANHLSGECAKVGTPGLASDKYQAQETVERLSTESNHNSSSTPAQMQKSPSFGLDLRIKARTEESDRIPLLYQDKTAIDDFPCQADISLGNPIAHTQYGQTTHVYQAMPVEEKVVTMERSDSEKSKTPFLGFLKEEEEAHIIVTPQKQDNNTAAKKANTKEVASASQKSKEKRKARSSLFTNCMCCTTVIN